MNMTADQWFTMLSEAVSLALTLAAFVGWLIEHGKRQEAEDQGDLLSYASSRLATALEDAQGDKSTGSIGTIIMDGIKAWRDPKSRTAEMMAIMSELPSAINEARTKIKAEISKLKGQGSKEVATSTPDTASDPSKAQETTPTPTQGDTSVSYTLPAGQQVTTSLDQQVTITQS